jgi:hypothetical protein
MSCRSRNDSHRRWRPDLISLSDIAVVEVSGNQPDLSPKSYDAVPLPKKLRYVAIPEMAVTKVRDQISNSASMLPVTGHRKSTNPLPEKLRCHIHSPRSYDHGRVRELAVPSGYDKETKHTQCHSRQCGCAENLDRSPRKVTLYPRNVVIFPPKVT